MTVKIERIRDLFDEDYVEEMLSYISDEEGVCHYNAATIAREFDDWGVTYVEGYLVGYLGHAINCVDGMDGTKHYFDITQEKFSDKVVFQEEFDTVKEYTFEEISDIFLEKGHTELVSVEVQKKF